MRKLLVCLAAMGGATLAVGTPAAGQFYPQPYGYNGYDFGRYGMDGRLQSVCSGQRGFSLESRLRHEEREGEIDPYAAMRIHRGIDRLEAQQRDECAEGDWRAISRIANGYDRIEQGIETIAHGYQPWDR